VVFKTNNKNKDKTKKTIKGNNKFNNNKIQNEQKENKRYDSRIFYKSPKSVFNDNELNIENKYTRAINSVNRSLKVPELLIHEYRLFNDDNCIIKGVCKWEWKIQKKYELKQRKQKIFVENMFLDNFNNKPFCDNFIAPKAICKLRLFDICKSEGILLNLRNSLIQMINQLLTYDEVSVFKVKKKIYIKFENNEYEFKDIIQFLDLITIKKINELNMNIYI